MTGQWRAFVGDWSGGEAPHDWAHLDKRSLTWEAARDLIRERLAAFDNDDCPSCRRDAADGLVTLDALPAGEPFEWDVEGSDYVIAPEQTEEAA